MYPSIATLPNGNEAVTFEWHRRNGDCYECAAPAAFLRCDWYHPRSEPHPEDELLCAVCAANAAADGESIAWIVPPD